MALGCLPSSFDDKVAEGGKSDVVFRATCKIPKKRLTSVSVVLEAAKEAAELEKRRYVPIIQGIDGVYQYSSEQLAAQLVGAATSLQQLKDGCTYAPAFTKRLATQHINTTTITDTICAAAKMPALSTNEDVLNKTAEARTRVWIVTALPACGYNFNKLCNLIDIDGANSVGLGK